MAKVGAKKQVRKHRRSGSIHGSSMTLKTNLVRRVAAANPQLYRRDVENIVKAILGEISAAMASGDRVELRGLGAFSLKHRPDRPSHGTVTKQHVFGSGGRSKTVYAVDAGSATLGSDLKYAFEKSVAKARRENKKKIGSSDAHIQK